MGGFSFLKAALAAGALALFSPRATAHTLPISYLFVVTDQDYVHLELSFNPFELADFSAFDTNRNSRLDVEELAFAEARITRNLLAHLSLRANGEVVAAETAGISPEADTHHATLRAHYRVDARHAALMLESSLPEITSGSHLTQINLLRDGKRELAQLDFQSHTATFSLPEGTSCDPTLPGACGSCDSSSGRGGMIAMSVAFGIVLLVTFQRSRRLGKTPPSASGPEPPNLL